MDGNNVESYEAKAIYHPQPHYWVVSPAWIAAGIQNKCGALASRLLKGKEVTLNTRRSFLFCCRVGAILCCTAGDRWMIQTGAEERSSTQDPQWLFAEAYQIYCKDCQEFSNSVHSTGIGRTSRISYIHGKTKPV